jgi:hypothetical protein
MREKRREGRKSKSSLISGCGDLVFFKEFFPSKKSPKK